MIGPSVNCWQDRGCGREPGGSKADEFGPCPAATDATCDGINNGVNAGRFCWAIPGTPCGESPGGTYAQKFNACRKCSFFRRVMCEQGCRFQLLKPGLGVTDPDVLHGKLNDLAALLVICRDIFAGTATGPVLAWITDYALTATSASAVGAYLADDQAEQLQLASCAGLQLLPESVSLDNESPIAQAVRNRKPCQGFVMLPEQTWAASIMAVPVGGDQKPAGVIALAGAEQGFSTDDQWMLGQLTLIARMSIGNCRFSESLRDLREVDKAKSKYVSLLLHDISSPLATIACALTAILQSNDDMTAEDRRELLEYSLKSANSISALSGKMLDLAAIRSGSHLASIEPVRISDVLRGQVEARELSARQRDMDISLDIGDESLRVSADRDGMGVIFGNLIDNAIKYSADKGGQIEVSLSATGDRLSVSVRDHGTGISQDVQDKLFKEFYRTPGATGSNVRGFGLGLAFVRELVDRYGGRIDMQSALGVGTCVTVEFPLLGPTAAGGELCQKAS